MIIQEMNRKIFIQGCGVVAPGAVESHTMLANNDSPRKKQMPVRRVTEFGVNDVIDQASLRRMDRFTQMAVVASELAMKDAGLSPLPEHADRVGIAFNSCFGPLDSSERYSNKLIVNGGKKAPAGLFPFTALNVFTGIITMRLKALGTNSTMCASSSVSYAVNAIRQWTDDTVLAGGVEELTDSMVRALVPDKVNCDARDKSSPSLAERIPIALSEGAAAVVLTGVPQDDAIPANALAQLHGYGQASNHTHTTPYAISPEIFFDAMQEAIAGSGIAPEQIDLLVCGANSYGNCEQSELAAARALFPEAHRPHAVNPKYQTGETLGAAEAFAVVQASTILNRQDLPTGLKLNRTLWQPDRQSSAIRYALVNVLEYGGVVTSYVLSNIITGN